MTAEGIPPQYPSPKNLMKRKDKDDNNNNNDNDATSRKKTKATPPKPNASPWDLHVAKRNAFVGAHPEILGPMCVKDLDNDDDSVDDDSEDEEDVDTSKITTVQAESFRYVMITQNREDQVESMRQLVLGDQAKNENCLMFDTRFSYHVLKCWKRLQRRELRARATPAQRLDVLFAFTHTISDHDVWMHDNEGGMGVLVKGLAAAWKKLLAASTDAALGWDVEYTKPGVMEFLGQFQTAVQAINDDLPKGNDHAMYDLGEFRFQ